MFTNKPWISYGATGRTGTLIAEEAVTRGHRPMLAGRDPDRLRGLAERSAVLAVEAALRSEPFGATTVARAFGSELSFEAGGELLAAA